MSSTVVQAIGASLFAWIIWIIVRKATSSDPLDILPGPPSRGFLKGNFPELVNPRGWEFHKKIAEEYGGVLKLKGFLGESQLYVYDPKALHHVIVKDQDVYEESDTFITSNNVVFGQGLLATMGEHHRKQRKMLNPVFSITHMREMIPIFYNVVNKLGDTFQNKVKNGPETIDVLAWMTRAALELIGQSGLGYSFDALTEEKGSESIYTVSVKLLVPSLHKLTFSRFVVLPLVANIGTPRFRRGVIDFLSLFWKNLRRVRNTVDIISNTSIEIFESKKRALREGDEALQSHIGRGKDIISILLKANMEASGEDKLPDSELLAQMSTLTFAAMDTTSNALSRIFHLLSTHPDAQEKLRQEITDAQREHGELSYDELINLPYLDAICRETMRLYPPVPMLLRQARKDMLLPVSKPVTGADGKQIEEVFVPKGTKVFISTLSSNCNPDLWGPDSYEWKPERWLSPLPDSLISAKIPGVYSHLMTFMGGGRSCIGFKFSQLEMKVVLAVLVPKFRFSEIHKNVFWQMTGIVTPILDESESLEPRLPLKVSVVRESEA